MQIRNQLATLALGLSLGLGVAAGPAMAQTHSEHEAAVYELTLNNGARWRGDDNMVKGMNAIRDIMASQLDAIHHDTLKADGYRTVAAEVEAQVNFMVENCKLEPAVDEQFHVVLAHVFDGISALRSDEHARDGAVEIVKALNAYGEHFEHPGWQPLK